MDLHPVWLSFEVATAATGLTVLAGLPLAWLLARRRFAGHDLLESAAMLAACVGSIALLVKAAQAGIESVDRRLEQAARTLGRSEWNIFWSVTLPLAWRSVIAGTTLAFCRALGDFGITLMVAGSIPGLTQTMPLAIYDRVQANQMHEANVLALIAVVSVTALLMGLGRLARVRF